ncbi:YihA family ribosome biogenesis GTP-binding protein [Brumimicrobium glaciale]|jgi:GTP-binding protein|uniref:Probable GTP-binding protein EngB n=1 Tax=Brumimicrobium glaciale TaxID=200475 RepID=A0A4Q4KQ36_9FLAO|nr:ribosome biogenesis GTP-binding protein YihA/YsxC [Brumimicrobium glaciale]RYM35678.1 YihA family ribosome biogenesis GTP-binding protein [Brumimicrobium glaciale]
MVIHSAEFVISNTEVDKCPEPKLAEYAFIGRSNVGKSSLINMLTNHKKLAKTSGKPGKTQLINHFIINKEWFLVDLPGYGYAKASKTSRKKWGLFIDEYLLTRENLLNTFILIDSRLEPQKIDVEFMEWCATKGLPFSMVFTKTDKLSAVELDKKLAKYKREMLKQWEVMPPFFVTSSVSAKGRDEVMNYIAEINVAFEPQ